MKNKKDKAQKIQEFVEAELSQALPITVLPDNSIVYKRYRIKQSKKGSYNLHFAGLDNRIVGTFNLKITALLAAKRHDLCQLSQFEEVKELDAKYWSNYADANFYTERLKITKDTEKYDIINSRLQEVKDRARAHKKKIIAMFRYAF